MLNRSRLVITEQIYWQHGQSQPLSVGKPHSRPLDTDEQPYGPRRLSVTTDWVNLDTGWVERASLIHISNEIKQSNVIPFREQVLVSSKKIIQLGIWIPPLPSLSDLWDGMVLPIEECKPGCTLRYCPPSSLDTDMLRIRCLNGQTTVMITAFPL